MLINRKKMSMKEMKATVRDIKAMTTLYYVVSKSKKYSKELAEKDFFGAFLNDETDSRIFWESIWKTLDDRQLFNFLEDINLDKNSYYKRKRRIMEDVIFVFSNKYKVIEIKGEE